MAADSETVAAVTAASVSSGFLQKFRLYETHMKFYLVGSNNKKTQWRVLIIDRLEPSDLNIHEDPSTYSTIECNDLLKRVHEGNTATGGLQFVTKCYGLAGFVKFLGPYYMLLITRRRKIGNICGHAVYGVSKSEMIIIPNSTVRSAVAHSKDENRSFVHSSCKTCAVACTLVLMETALNLQKTSCYCTPNSYKLEVSVQFKFWYFTLQQMSSSACKFFASITIIRQCGELCNVSITLLL